MVVAGRRDRDRPQAGQRRDVRAGQPGGRGDRQPDDVGAGRDVAADGDVVAVGPVRLGLEPVPERGLETGQDLLVTGAGDEGDPRLRGGNRVQSL
jgi:hypothetical protein